MGGLFNQNIVDSHLTATSFSLSNSRYMPL